VESGAPTAPVVTFSGVPAQRPAMAQETISVEGMACGSCEETVESAVAALEGTESVEADNTTDTVEIEGDVDGDAVADAIEDAGYTVLG
jgi:copper chaperone